MIKVTTSVSLRFFMGKNNIRIAFYSNTFAFVFTLPLRVDFIKMFQLIYRTRFSRLKKAKLYNEINECLKFENFKLISI